MTNAEELDLKLKDLFDGKIVRKDILHEVKKGTNIPTFVLEFEGGGGLTIARRSDSLQHRQQRVQVPSEETLEQGDSSDINEKLRSRHLGEEGDAKEASRDRTWHEQRN